MKNGSIKRIGALALCTVLAASAFACKGREEKPAGNTPEPVPTQNAPTTGGVDDVRTTMPPENTAIPDARQDGFDAKFIRIAYSQDANSTAPFTVTSVEKLREVLTEKMSNSVRSSATVDDYLKEYSEDFFKDHYILVFNLTFSSGSVIPGVSSVTLENDTVTVTTVGGRDGEVGTTDMASHMCLLALDAEKYPESSKFVVTGAGTADTGARRANG